MIPTHPVRPQPVPAPRAARWLAVLLGLVAVSLQAQQPTGGTVVVGSATIASSANSTVVTAGDNSVLRWNSFDVGTGETVQFVQPGASSRVLNWIGGATPSQINGSLLANGQVYLMNPSGVYFGQTAVINVGALYAVGGTMTKDDFLSGMNRFSGLTGDVVNAGSIRGEMVALVGRSVANTGSIVSPGGFIGLASGEQVLLGQNGSSIYVDAGRSGAAGPAAAGPGVANTGTIDSGAGSTVLAAGDLYSIAITQDGRLAGRDVRVQGQGRGDVLVSGTIDATGETGGRVEITGERVGLTGRANIDASGSAGGGTVLVGGDYQGKNPAIRNATATFVAPGATIRTDAYVNGNGGKVIVWGNEAARVYGSIFARGGSASGDGGFIETSGAFLDLAGINIDATAPAGQGGRWLIDPNNITIQAAGSDTVITGSPNFTTSNDGAILLTGTIETQLNAGTSVTITTGTAGTNAEAGNISVADDITKTGGTAASLTLAAHNTITLGAGVNITSSSDTLNVTLSSNHDNTGGGAIVLNSGSSIVSNGGNLLLGGGDLVGGGNAVGEGANAVGILLDNATLDAGAGNITLRGTGLAGTSGAYGIRITGGADLVTTSSGAITLTGTSGAGGVAGNNGVGIDGAGTSITAVDGAIGITGTGFGSGSANTGVTITSATISSTGAAGTGTITITGTGGAGSDNHGVIINSNAPSTVNSVTGNITITGNGGAGASSYGVVLEASSLTGFAGVKSTGSADITLIGTTAGTGFGLQSRDGGSGITNVIGDAAMTGDITLRAGTTGGTDSISLANVSILGAGNLFLEPGAAATSVGVAGGAGVFDLSAAEIGTFANGFSSITIGRADGTGTTTVNAVTFNDPITIRAPGTGGVISTSGTLATVGNALTFNSDTMSLGAVDTGAGLLTINNSGAATQSGVFAGSGGLTKLGAGTLTLSQINTYTGATTISAGTLSVATIGDGGVAGNLGQATNAATDLVLSGGTLQYTGATASTDRNFTLTAATTSTIDVTTGANTLTLSGASAATAGSLTKAGAGGLTLTGQNLHTGTTTVSAGTLTLGHATNTLDNTSSLVVSGGTLDLGGNADTVAGVQLTGGTVQNGTLTSTTDFDVQAGTASAVLAGGVGLTKTGSGSVTLSGANTYTGTTTINAGTLVVGAAAPSGSAGALGNAASAVLLGDTSGSANAALLINGAFTVARDVTVRTGSSGTATIGGTNTSGSSAFSGTIMLDKGAILTAANGGTTGFSGAINDGAGSFTLGLDGATGSTLNLSGAVTVDTLDITATAQNLSLTGATGTITSAVTFDHTGTLLLGQAGGTQTYTAGITATAPTTTTLNGAINSPGAAQTYGPVALGSDVTLSATTATFNGAVTGTADSLGITGDAVFGDAANDSVTGLSTLSVSGATTINTDTITTSGTQDYTGAVSVGNDTTLSTTNSDVTFGSTVGSATATAKDLTVGAGSGVITLTGAVGATNPLADLTLSTTSSVTLPAITADSVSVTAAGVALNANITTVNATTLNNTGSVTGAGVLAAGTLNLNGSGNFGATGGGNSIVTITPVVNVATTGGASVFLDNQRTGGVTVSGTVTGSNNTVVSIASHTNLGAGRDNIVIDTGGLTNSGTGSSITILGKGLFLNGDITSPTITLDLVGGDLTGSSTLAAAVALQLEGTGNVGASGSLISINTPSLTLNKSAGDVFVNNGANALTLTETLFSGTGEFTSGALTLGSAISTAGDLTFNTSTFALGTNAVTGGTVTINNSGALTGTGLVTATTLNLNGLGAVGVDAANRINTEAGTINFSKGATAGAAFLAEANGATLTGSTQGAVNITTTTGTLTLSGLTAAGGFTAPGAALALTGTIAGPMSLGSNVSLSANTTFSGAVTLTNGITITTGASTLTFSSGVDGAFALIVNATGGAVEFFGGVGATTPLTSLSVTGLARVSGTIDTSGNTQNWGNLTLTGNTTFTDVGDINFNGTVDGAFTLTADTGGTGHVLFTGLVGDTTPLGAITITNANNLTANGVRAASFVQTTGQGTTTLNGGTFTDTTTEALSTTSATGVSITAKNITVNSSVTAGSTGDVDLLATANGGGNVILTGTTTAAGDTVTVNAAGAINGAGLVTAATVDLNAVSGIGNTTALELAASTITADTTNGNIDLDNALGTTATYTTLTTGTGTITVDNSGGGAAVFTTATTTDGLIDLENTAGDLTATSVTANGAGDVTLTTTTSGNVVLGSITATGNDVTVNSVGQINDEANDAVADITAATTTLTAGTGIGVASGNVDLGVPTVTSVTSGTGGVNLNNLTGVAVGSVSTTTSGSIAIIGTAAITMNGAVSTTGGGTVVLNSGGALTFAATGDINADGGVSLTGSTGISTAGDITTTADTVTFNSATTLAGAVAINTTSGNAAGANIIFSTTLDGTQSLGLTAGTAGDVTFTGLVGDMVTLGAITINSADDVTANGVRAASLVQTDGTGTTTLNQGNFTAGTDEAVTTTAAAGVNITNETIALNHAITTTGNGIVTLNADTTTLTIGAAGDITADGTVSLTGNTGISTAGDITTTADDVTYVSPTTLTGPVVISTGAGAGTITFTGTLNATTAGVEDLTLTAGTGDIVFSGVVGGTTRLGDVTINSAANVTATTFSATTLTQSAGSGTTTLNGAVNTNAAGGISLTGTNLAVNNTVTTTNAGPITVNESVTVTIAAVGDITSDGAVSLTATGGISTAGDITTTNDALTFASATTLTGNVVIDSGSANIGFDTTLNGGFALTANSTGTTTFTGAVGGSTALASLTTNAGGTTAINGGAVTTTGAQTYNDNVTLGANTALSATTATFNGTVAGSGNNLGVTGNAVFGDATTDSVTGLGTLSVSANTTINTDTITSAGTQTYTGAVTLGADTTLTTTDSAVLFSSTVNSTGGARDLTVNAGTAGITFTGAVGGGAVLDAMTLNSTGTTTFSAAVSAGSLTTNAGGTTAVNGGSITTSGTQTYNDDVTVGTSNATLTTTNSAVLFAGTTTLNRNLAVSSGSGTVTFTGAVDGANSLSVSASGTTTFTSAVGGGTALSALTTNGGGTTAINGGSVTTTGAQAYTDVATLNADTTLATTNSAVTFSSTIDSFDTTARDLTVNTGSGLITLSGAIGGTNPLDVITLNSTAGAGIALPATTAQTLTVSAAGPLTDNGALIIPGVTTLAAGAGNSITLNNANNFGTVVITSGLDVTLVDINAIDLGASTISDDLTLTAGGNITQSGVLTVADDLTLALTTPNTDILLSTQANNLGPLAPVLAGTVSNIRDLALRNVNAGAQAPVISPATTNLNGLTSLRNLTLIYDNAPINLPGLTASGTMTITAGGAITDSAPSVVPGTSNFNANGFDIILDAPGNSFGTVSLNGGTITLTNVSLVNLAGVTSTGAFTLSSLGSLTISSPISSGSTVNLGSTGGDLNIDASIGTTSGNITLSAAQNVTASAAGTVTTAGGSVTVTAGANAQLAGITTGSGAVTINSPGVTTFISPITNIGSLLTDAPGSTVIGGGQLTVANSFRFNDPVTLSAALTLGGPAGRFNSTLNGGQALTANLTGNLTFVGAVGGTQPLASITSAAASAILYYGGQVRTTGAQIYNGTVLLGTNTTMGASALTFNGPLNTGPALVSLSGLNAATTGESDLIANVSGATIFNAPVGQLTRLGDVTTDAGGTTIIRANFNSTRLTVNDPMTFDTAAAITVDTTGSQFYNSSVTLGTNLTFNSTLSAVFNATASPAEGIYFAQGLSAAGRTVTITAPGATITAGGDLGTQDSRLALLSAAGRYMVVHGDIWAQGDIALAVGTGTTGDNDFLQFTAPGGTARNTRLDSVDGEIILGSGATGGAEKTSAPVRSSIFKTNEGDLYLFARKVTVQPFERMVVRNGSLIAIADGTAATDGITLGSTAATNYLVLVSSTAREVPGIQLRSRGPAGIDSSLGAQDQGTDLIAGAVFFFNTNFSLPGTVPTREVFAPVPATAGTFNYQLLTGNILSAFGPLAIRILPDSGGVAHNVYVADMVLSNRFRPVVGNLIYLDLNTGPGFSPGRFINGLGPFVDPASDLLGLSDVQPLRPLVSLNTAPRTVLQSAFTPNVPREDRETAPPEVDLSPAVREQLQALGIYARALRPSEARSRELRMGLFTTIPERERPRESDYEVADARVENRAVREVLRLATEAGLIGEGQAKLDEVARALAASYEAFSVLSLSQEAKDFRTWLEASTEPDSVRVLTYVKTLHETLKGIELLGLTRQELASSKAQIYGSILRARLNAEPEFLRSLVEDTATPTQVSAVGSPTVAPGSLAQAALR